MYYIIFGPLFFFLISSAVGFCIVKFLPKFIDSKLNGKSKSDRIKPDSFSVQAYLDRMEQAALEILEKQEPVEQIIVLWWGLDGLRLNEDGTMEWISRKKPPETVFYQPCQSIQTRKGFSAIPPEAFSMMCNVAGIIAETGDQTQSTKAQIDALMAQNAALQMQNAIQQCYAQYPAQYPTYYYGGCCWNYLG